MYKGISNIPFFLYYMYGQNHPKKDSIDVILIKTPTGYYNTKNLSGREEELLLKTVDFYIKLKKGGDFNLLNIKNRFTSPQIKHFFEKAIGNDTISVKQFPAWWASYYKQIALPNQDSVTLVKSSISTTFPYLKSKTDSVIFTVKTK